MTVVEIVKKHLTDNGYDGLYTDECGCLIDDLMPCCSECAFDCEPGYKMSIDDAKKAGYDVIESCDYIIVGTKPEGEVK